MNENKHTYSVHTNAKIKLLAKANNINLCMPDTNTVTISLPENVICPDITGIRIGHTDVNTGELISNIKGDDDATQLQKYIDLGLVKTLRLNQLNKDNKLTTTNHYFFIYEIDDSSKHKPTTLNGGPGYGMPTNGYYKCTYEVLLTNEEHTRRMIFTTNSVNIPMCEWITEFIDTIDELKRIPREDIRKFNSDLYDNDFKEYTYQFYVNDDNQLCYTMFDPVGNPVEVEFDTQEFKSSITSIRQIECKFVNDNN